MKIKVFFLTIVLYIATFSLPHAYADTATDNALAYLKAKQAASGQITGGSTGDASSWAAIAFSAQGIASTSIKNPTNSLSDYLLSNHPTTTSSATEWEKWILAITASGQNPYNFGGVNYVTTLMSAPYYNNNQIGDSTSVNDDWFGVLALISSGIDKSDPVLTNSLSFILSHQNTDGGYGYATTAGSDGNDTAAAIQALEAAKNYGVSATNLDSAIANAKTYLLSTQDKTGGFLYDTNTWTTAPDADSTTWALMALNVLGMQSSTQASNAKTWLLSQQALDGGFQACQYNPPDYTCQLASNSTTTSHALIGLAGKGWVIKVFDASTLSPTPTIVITPTPTASISPTLTPGVTITPTATPTSPTSIPTPTPIYITNTVYVTPTPSPVTATPTPQIIYITKIVSATPDITQGPTPAVLGAQTQVKTIEEVNPLKFILPIFFGSIGLGLLGIYLWRIFYHKK